MTACRACGAETYKEPDPHTFDGNEFFISYIHGADRPSIELKYLVKSLPT